MNCSDIKKKTMRNQIAELVSLVGEKDELKLDDSNRDLVKSVDKACRRVHQYLGKDAFLRHNGELVLLKIDAKSVRLLRNVDKACLIKAMGQNAAKFRETTRNQQQ